jgi:hypothetical protein
LPRALGDIDTKKILCSIFRNTLEAPQMRIAVIFAVSALLVAPSGLTEAANTCISKATEALPRISGLVVKKSRARGVSPAILSTWKGQSKPVIIDVDFEAAGEAQTYSYMCVVTQGSAFVQRTMN